MLSEPTFGKGELLLEVSKKHGFNQGSPYQAVTGKIYRL